MSGSLKLLFLVIMGSALIFGFMHLIIPPEQIDFDRLHIFLFNLCSGGTLILCFSEDRQRLTVNSAGFLLLAGLFAICAFLHWYLASILLAWVLAVIVERVRVATFGSVWPGALFTKKESVARKFHQASLLCLTLALLFSSFALINHHYGHWFSFATFNLNIFFLGFSFPVSLISMSVIFEHMDARADRRQKRWQELSFWAVNLGVIIFFLFILGHFYRAQFTIALLLFVVVLLILRLYSRLGSRGQQKTFLTSGIFFLLITAVSGILYIYYRVTHLYAPEQMLPLLNIHVFTALYGWNLCGMVVIFRRHDFPIKLHSQWLATLHWFTVAGLCPLGYFFRPFAVAAVVCYLILLQQFLFSHGTTPEKKSMSATTSQ